MSDTHAAEAQVGGGEAAPVVVEGDNFDQEFSAFLNHSFGDDEEFAEGEIQTPEGEDDATPKAGDEQPKEDAADNAGQPPASEGAAASATPDPAAVTDEVKVDPADLAALMGLPTAQAPEPKTDAAPAAEEPYTPFNTDFSLPPEMTHALFEADDPAVRAKALVTLLASFGNTITSVMDDRIASHHGSRFASRIAEMQTEASQTARVHSHFYGEYPELLEHRPIVAKTFEVMAKRNPSLTYSPELAQQIAATAVAVLKNTGVTLELGKLKKAPAAPAAKKPAAKAGKAFEAGGARPADFHEAPNPDSPQGLVDILSEF